jgi:predicted TIM-barrel fold metal-dependent hydrolase
MNPMKIICIEEHTVDAAIAKATQQAQTAEAGYMADWGSRVQDKVSPTDTRPRLLPIKATMTLAPDVSTGRIAEMDKHHIDMQIVSYSSSPQLAPAAQAIDLTRAANDKLAEAVHANPTRFDGFATLPWQDPQAAAKELERAIKELGLVGTLLSGRPGQSFLDDDRYEPILAKLNELQVPVYVHPGFPLPQVREPYYGGLDKEVSARLSLFGWGWHNEAGIQVIRMILSGKFEKFPNLQVISGHWGEMVPFYLQRMDDTIPQEATQLSRSITDTYKAHVSVTPSGMLNLPHFEFIHKVLGADRIIYAVDYPYLTLSGARQFLEDLPISQEDKEKIAHRNVETLLHLR